MTTTPQALTLEGVKAACREAYRNDELLAQDPKNEACRYVHEGRRCAIGVALSDETLRIIAERGLMTSPITELDTLGIVTVEDRSELHWIEHIQGLHDAWVTGWHVKSRGWEDEFKREIDLYD
jgi:hypothetical protein